MEHQGGCLSQNKPASYPGGHIYFQTGARLSTFSTGEKGPCNGVQPLPFDPPRVLIAMLYCLYLVDGEDMMEVLWKVDSTRGLIR